MEIRDEERGRRRKVRFIYNEHYFGVAIDHFDDDGVALLRVSATSGFGRKGIVRTNKIIY